MIILLLVKIDIIVLWNIILFSNIYCSFSYIYMKDEKGKYMKTKSRHPDDKEYGILDRFIIKLFISFLLILIVVILNKYHIIDLKKMQNAMSEQINIAKIVETVTGNSSLIDFPIDSTTEVDATSFLSITKTDGTYKIDLGSYEAVEALHCGVVVKIVKNIDNTYLVVVKGIDGFEYHYDQLTQINVNIYQLLEGTDVIGKASQNDNHNYYLMTVYSKGASIDYFS